MLKLIFCKYTTAVHIQKRAIKKLVTHVESHTSALMRVCVKLQAPVYDILPSTTAVFCYAIGSRKLLANEQFFVGAQTVVHLLQTTRIK